MRKSPIIFNSDDVRAILDGRKTQTRRIAKTSYERGFDGPVVKNTKGAVSTIKFAPIAGGFCPLGDIGDQLWVRETTVMDDSQDCPFAVLAKYQADGKPVLYSKCDDEEYKGSCAHWWYSKPVCPSIHMPRWAARIQLEITGVRVERLKDISEDDAKLEGFELPVVDGMSWKFKARHNFRFAWDSIYKNWDENPWVWVIEFKRVEV